MKKRTKSLIAALLLAASAVAAAPSPAEAYWGDPWLNEQSSWNGGFGYGPWSPGYGGPDGFWGAGYGGAHGWGGPWAGYGGGFNFWF